MLSKKGCVVARQEIPLAWPVPQRKDTIVQTPVMRADIAQICTAAQPAIEIAISGFIQVPCNLLFICRLLNRGKRKDSIPNEKKSSVATHIGKLPSYFHSGASQMELFCCVVLLIQTASESVHDRVWTRNLTHPYSREGRTCVRKNKQTVSADITLPARPLRTKPAAFSGRTRIF